MDASLVGTDPAVAASADRGTGSYRVPSLRGVGSGGHLFHDASVKSIEALLDPSREGAHRFGLSLNADDRASIVSWLHAL